MKYIKLYEEYKEAEDESFDEWWENNRNSEMMIEDYENAKMDLEDTEEKMPSFKEWAKGVWKREN